MRTFHYHRFAVMLVVFTFPCLAGAWFYIQRRPGDQPAADPASRSPIVSSATTPAQPLPIASRDITERSITSHSPKPATTPTWPTGRAGYEEAEPDGRVGVVVLEDVAPRLMSSRRPAAEMKIEAKPIAPSVSIPLSVVPPLPQQLGKQVPAYLAIRNDEPTIQILEFPSPNRPAGTAPKKNVTVLKFDGK